MQDRFYHEPELVNSIIDMLINNIDDYRYKVGSLKKVVNDINSSNMWVDNVLKTEYLASASSYITRYEKIVDGLEIYLDYLKKKSGYFEQVETDYSKRG